jgi:hypothetical protein
MNADRVSETPLTGLPLHGRRKAAQHLQENWRRWGEADADAARNCDLLAHRAADSAGRPRRRRLQRERTTHPLLAWFRIQPDRNPLAAARCATIGIPNRFSPDTLD